MSSVAPDQAASARSRAASSRAVVLLALFLVSFSGHVVLAAGHPDYADALAKSLLFFQGQRSGRLPPDQAVTWRSNSGMSDGSAANVSKPSSMLLLVVQG